MDRELPRFAPPDKRTAESDPRDDHEGTSTRARTWRPRTWRRSEPLNFLVTYTGGYRPALTAPHCSIRPNGARRPGRSSFCARSSFLKGSKVSHVKI